jgi:hypothetical protein
LIRLLVLSNEATLRVAESRGAEIAALERARHTDAAVTARLHAQVAALKQALECALTALAPRSWETEADVAAARAALSGLLAAARAV